MATYAIGDVQGCHDELLALLDKIAFNPVNDRVLLVGDLVNRGPKSLETLRTLRELGDAAVCVLGNHDLHLLAVAHGISRTKHRDTFADVLSAPDRDELLFWLRHRPLLHNESGFYLIHAGLPPQWTMEQAMACAREAEAALRGADPTDCLWHIYGNDPDHWEADLSDWDRIRFITNCFTRLRYCTEAGQLDLRQKGAPGSQPAGLVPWFLAPHRRSRDARILFGHWSTLGYYQGEGVCCLDTGCLWGGTLTALRLEDHTLHAVPNLQGGYQRPARHA